MVAIIACVFIGMFALILLERVAFCVSNLKNNGLNCQKEKLKAQKYNRLFPTNHMYSERLTGYILAKYWI